MDQGASTQLDFETLQRFAPLGRLSPDSLRDVQRNAAMRAVPAGKTLFSAGDEDDWSLYLLDGRVELSFSDGNHEHIAAASDSSRLPLAPQTPRPASARTATDVTLIRVPRSLLDIHIGSSDRSAVEVEESEVELEQLQQRLLEKMFHDYVNQHIKVPVLPDVAIRVRESLADENVTPQKMADIVSSDPTLAARLVQVANSPACRGVVEVSGCRDAISRLGMPASRDIVTSMAVSNVFNSESALLKQRMSELWRKSARIGAISCVLARESGKVSPDRAMLAGLVHDIGAIAVVAGSDAYPELSHRPGALDAAVVALRAQFGSMVLRAWDFTDEIVAAAVEVDDWERDGSAPDCCDVVQVATLLHCVGTPVSSSMPKLSQLPAFHKLDLGVVGPDDTLQLIDEADEAIKALENTLAP